MAPTLRAVVGTPGLGLRVAAGAAALDRRVGWVAVSEQEDPTPYLEGGELLLTTGMRLDAGGAWAAEYVARLVARGVGGLGFGTGLGHERVPPALVAAAEAAGMPLVEVPEPTPFVAIGKTVSQIIAAERHEALTRTAAAQRALARAALRPDGPHAVVERLAAELHGWAVLLDASGVPRYACPPEAAAHAPGLAAETARLRRLLRHRSGASTALSGDTGHVVIQPLGDGGRVTGFLAVGTETPLPTHAHATVATATSLLSLTLQRPPTPRPLRSTLLTLLITGTPPPPAAAGVRQAVGAGGAPPAAPEPAGTPPTTNTPPPSGTAGTPSTSRTAGAPPAESGTTGSPSASGVTGSPPAAGGAPPGDGLLGGLAASAAADGGLPREPVRVSVVGGDVSHVLDGLETGLRGLDDAGVLVGEVEGRVTVLLPDDEAVVEAIAGEAGAVMGLSRAVPLARAGEAYRQAVQALAAPGDGPVRRHEAIADGGLVGLLDADAAQGFAAATLRPLLEYRSRADLVGSLRAFLAHAGHWDAAAESLGVHRHTLRYRMRRVADLLARDLSDPDVRADLWIALRILGRVPR